MDAPALVPYAEPSRPWNRLVILGEAPGAAEAAEGRPFIGRSGKLLDEALAAVEIDREACLVANVFRVRPPKNDPRHFFVPGKAPDAAHRFGRSGIGYCREAFAGELDYLAARLADARAILALGAIPLWATTGFQGVTARAGRAILSRLAPIPALPTYHPAYILRGNFHLIPSWRDHMRLAMRLLTWFDQKPFDH